MASTGWISNAAVNGNYHLRLAHQGGASETLLELTAKDGTILYSKAFSNAAFTDRSFWGASYLQALFNPISGYGSYAIGDFTLTEYPPEAVEPEDWIGTYMPLEAEKFNVNNEAALKWLKEGAQPTDTAKNILSEVGVMEAFHNSKRKNK